MTKRFLIPCLVLLFCGSHLAAENALSLNVGASQIKFTTPAPVLWNGEQLPLPDFDANGLAELKGLRLQRTLEKIDGGYRVKLTLTNLRRDPIELKTLIPLQVEGNSALVVAGKSIPDWQIFRLSRQKNDIPGPYFPARDNDATRDAAVDESDSQSDDPTAAKTLGSRFHADPGFVVMAQAEPATTNLFIGFDGQTEHLSDLLLEMNAAHDAMTALSARAEFDGVTIPPGTTRTTHYLYMQTGKDYRELLADHVARIKRQYGSRFSDPKAVFCTWYFYGPEIVASDLREDLAELKRRPVKFDLFLIDYGWADNFGDWTATGSRFPDGMKEMADEIKAGGFTPGIWTAPFLIAPDAEILKRHPDLLLKYRNGKNVEFKMPAIGKGRFNVIDPTATGAEEVLTELCQRLRGWGYDYLKFDFLRGLIMHDAAAFHDRTVNRAQAYRRAMEILRKAAGEDAIIGAWGGLFEANAGIVNINRSGSDVRGHWDAIRDYSYITRYPVRMRQTFARSFYDEKLFTSDQDALQLRRRDTPWRKAKPHLSMGLFTDEEAFSTVVYRFLGGGIVQVSEKLDDLPQDRFDLYRMVIPSYAPVAQNFKKWDDYLPEFFVSHFPHHASLPPWSVVSLCNWNGNATKNLNFRAVDVPGLPSAPAYAAFEFKTQQFLGVFKPTETIALELAAHATRVIRLTPLLTTGTQLVGTDLNLSNGMEIEQVNGTQVKLKREERDFPAKFTFINYDGSTARIQTTSAAQ